MTAQQPLDRLAGRGRGLSIALKRREAFPDDSCFFSRYRRVVVRLSAVRVRLVNGLRIHLTRLPRTAPHATREKIPFRTESGPICRLFTLHRDGGVVADLNEGQ
jgi:hypothetical protein